MVHPKHADRMANSVGSDQTAQEQSDLGSGSTLFAKTGLSKNLGSLR